MRPDLLHGLLETPTVKDLKVLVRHGVGVIDAGDLLHAGETLLKVPLLPLHHDDALPGVVPRSPEEVILVSADGGR